mgnify:CR=1 FL=1
MDLEDKDMDTEATTRETSKAKIKSEAKPSVRQSLQYVYIGSKTTKEKRLFYLKASIKYKAS